jgi:group I intron endonuclease
MQIDITKEVLKKWGVYKITNIITGDYYIGSTIETFEKRLAKHISSFWRWKLANKKSDCPILYNAFNKYDINNFKFEIIIYFNRKKDSNFNKLIITYLEEKYINKFLPKYNICKKPTLSGCPNLGRKLSQEWKDNIGKKSLLYKHSNNQEIYLKKVKQNKDLSSIYKVWKENLEFEGSLIECSNFTNHSISVLLRWLKKPTRNSWNIIKLKSQKKKIKLLPDKIFNSFSECDKFLNMWRGFTSTQVINKKDKILDYQYELI